MNRRGLSPPSAQCNELESLLAHPLCPRDARQLNVAVGFMASTLDLSGSRAICSFVLRVTKQLILSLCRFLAKPLESQMLKDGWTEIPSGGRIKNL